MKLIYIRSLVIGLLLFSSNNAFASFIYQYTGANYTSAPNPYNTSMNISLTLELGSLLTANMSNTVVTPLSFNISDGVHTLTDLTDTSSGFFGTEFFRFNTDSFGAITGWSFKVRESFLTIGQQGSSVESFFSGGIFASDKGTLLECTIITTGNCTTLTSIAQATNSGTPGTWTVSNVPVPAAIWLMGSGLIGLMGFSCRKGKSKSWSQPA